MDWSEFQRKIQINNDISDELPSITILERMEVSEFEAVIYNPVICIILQGSKETSIGDQRFHLTSGDMLVVSHDMPVTSKITEASAERPYLALIFSLDLSTIRSLYEQVGEAINETSSAQALSKSTATPDLMDALSRYLECQGNAPDIHVLGPGIRREIHYRLLMSPIGASLRNLLSVDSHASRISKAIIRIRSGYQDTLASTELAQIAGMSPSSFHAHFKSITGTTPLRYQKDLRMIKARELLALGQQSVTAIGYDVGYESAAQFSREYSRKFGVPPSHDLPKGAPAMV